MTTIVEKLVSLDLLYDTAKPLDKMVVATICVAADKRCTHNVKTETRVAKAGSGLANLVASYTYGDLY